MQDHHDLEGRNISQHSAINVERLRKDQFSRELLIVTVEVILIEILIQRLILWYISLI